MKRPARWEIQIAMDFKNGKSIASLTANNFTSEREQVESIIRDVLIWQEDRRGEEVGED